MGQRPDGAREPLTGPSGNRCSWNASCRRLVAGERGGHEPRYRQAGPAAAPSSWVEAAGSGHDSWAGPRSLRARPHQPARARPWPGPGNRALLTPWDCWQGVYEHLYLGKPLSVILPGTAPMNGPASYERSDRSPYTFHRRGPFSAFVILVRLIEENGISQGADFQQRRGTVMPVLGRP